MDLITRERYLYWLRRVKGQDLVRLLTGVRRSGKSSLLQLYREELVNQGVKPSQIWAVNFEDYALQPLRDPAEFHRQALQRVQNGLRYLFIDEAQELGDWARVVNSLRAEHGLEIYVTGSNATIFAGMGLTYLSGRYVSLEVFPLSLAEFRQFRRESRLTPHEPPETDTHRHNPHQPNPPDPEPIEKTYAEWLKIGGFPRSVLEPSDQLAYTLNADLFESIVARDVLLANDVRDPQTFQAVARFVFDTAGSGISASRIANTLSSRGQKTTHHTVATYLELLESAHIIYRCPRFDIRGKKLLSASSKYYFVDPGLRRVLLGSGASNRGHDLENMVFLELRRRGWQVAVGALGGGEVDFRVDDGRQTTYIQVCFDTSSLQVLSRELRPFAALPPGARAVLISADRIPPDCGEVAHLDAFDFLLGADLP